MLTFLVVVHVTVCVLLIALVLLQDPKGGAAGGIFGGSSNSLLGATGATSFLTRLTRGVAITFGVLCILLVWTLKRNTGSVLDTIQLPVPPPSTAPAVPGTTNPGANPSGAATVPAGSAAGENKAADSSGNPSSAPDAAAPAPEGNPAKK